MIKVQLQLYPMGGGSATGGPREFAQVPAKGEAIVTGSGSFVVTEVQWQLDGTPVVIAHWEARR